MILVLDSNPGQLVGQEEKADENPTKADQESQEKDEKKLELPWERKRENRIPRLTKLNERELLNDVSEEELLSIKDHLPLKLLVYN